MYNLGFGASALMGFWSTLQSWTLQRLSEDYTDSRVGFRDNPPMMENQMNIIESNMRTGYMRVYIGIYRGSLGSRGILFTRRPY